MFTKDWKEINRYYAGHECEVLYNGVEYLPLLTIQKFGYNYLLKDIEEIKHEN